MDTEIKLVQGKHIQTHVKAESCRERRKQTRSRTRGWKHYRYCKGKWRHRRSGERERTREGVEWKDDVGLARRECGTVESSDGG